MGNPSDGFFGKTISLSIANYWAEVTIAPSDRFVAGTGFKKRASCISNNV
jgi:hypothetical protein